MMLPNPLRRRVIERLGGELEPALVALFEEAGTAALVTDRAAQFVRCNARLRSILAELGTGLAIGQPVDLVFHPDDRSASHAVLDQVLRTGTPAVASQARLAATDLTRERVVAVSIAALREADGEISGSIMQFTDLTSERRLEAQVAHSQKLLAVAQLAGGVAHDFNNLLTAILGAADAVLERGSDAADTIADVRQIRQSAERGAALVRQLLAFGRRQPLAARVVAVNAAIHASAETLRRLAGPRVRLVLGLEEPGRMVRIDPGQLEQVLINLASNAVDAMPGGGTLTVRTGHRVLFHPEPHGPEIVPPGRYVMVEVADTGQGIAADLLPRVFEPFFTTRRDRGGSGLGLSTVHGIVRQSGGFIAVDSAPNVGTTIRIWLPRHDAGLVVSGRRPDVAMPPPAQRDMAMPPSPLTLLVEDEEPVRRLAERALVRAGWQVQAADSAETLMETLPQPGAKDRPSVLVSDVVLPGMDGLALVAAVRAVWPGLPAVLVSGYAESALQVDALPDGVVYLPKPYRLRELLECLDRVAGRAAVAEVSPCMHPPMRT